MTGVAGIVAAATCFPDRSRRVSDVCRDEGSTSAIDRASRLGLESVRTCDGETGSDLAATAAREALGRAGIEPAEIDVIVDYSVLPQEYLVPAWSMSNKLQAVLGAKKAFTVGFSGGDSTNLLVALEFAGCLLASDPAVKTALLLGADLALPGNRLLNRDDPVTILGDGASALVLRRDAPRSVLVDVEVLSDGDLHDVCYIPGGGMAHPDREDLYRLTLDRERYEASDGMGRLFALASTLLDRAGIDISDVAYFLYPNLSAEDQDEFASAFGGCEDRMCRGNVSRYGHVQGTDLVANYLSATGASEIAPGDAVLACSHGFGFMAGAALFRY